MAVYVLYWINFQGNEEFSGVFSSEEKAKERITQYRGEPVSNFRIESENVDERLS